ncbi:hypothetical protein JRQ81_004480 [Phrynocephalus forsythii]|uniref:Uncharacterized protein n=1 Tax=Phrynocephalus forsythii TaxID=171643 RepID=A0A9Q0XF89_9SAUR|nr:hypothetical protein JRQ81_004480 [Phrynocephalus forsythii]
MYPYKARGTDAFGTPLQRIPPRAGREGPKRTTRDPLQAQNGHPKSREGDFLSAHGIHHFPGPVARYSGSSIVDL